MKFLDKIIAKPSKMQSIIGLSFAQFKILSGHFDIAWEDAEEQRKLHPNRKRKIGAGHPYALESSEHKLLAVLIYYKSYLTQNLLGLIIDLDQANVSRLLGKILPLIEQIADPELATYLEKAKQSHLHAKKTNSFDEFFKNYSDLRDVAIDAEEQECYRSKKYELQKHYYSGKKKRHTIKTQFSVSTITGRILDVSNAYGGSVHDKTLIDQEKTVQKFSTKTCLRFDSGYQGIKKKNPDHYTVSPTKKPKNKELSSLAKEHNRVNSRKRIIVEHIFSRLKKFKICSDRYRGPTKNHNQTVKNVAAILNFKLANPAIIM